MNAYTPGPWHVAPGRAIKASAGAHICFVDGNAAQSEERINDNARLIAAAPELLEALRELVERCDGAEGVREDGSNIQTMKAHAALAKAGL